jgi:predicted TIM-barrel fold metal-dependent hydrolase
VTKSVHIQGGFDPADPVSETRWLQSLADSHGFPHGIVAAADLSQRGVGGVLEAHAGFANTRGIRQNLNYDPDDPTACFIDRDCVSDRQWRAGFSLLEGLGFSFDLQILPRQLMDGVGLARTFPGTRIILCHMGLPFRRDPAGLEEWRSGLRLLATEPNTSVKVSGFGMIDHQWRVSSIRPLVLETIDVFGPGRCMFASNFPVDGLYSSYSAVWAALIEITAGFSADERAGMFGGNAQRTYRLFDKASATGKDDTAVEHGRS